jgi:hypothetical protein
MKNAPGFGWEDLPGEEPRGVVGPPLPPEGAEEVEELEDADVLLGDERRVVDGAEQEQHEDEGKAHDLQTVEETSDNGDCSVGGIGQ